MGSIDSQRSLVRAGVLALWAFVKGLLCVYVRSTWQGE